MSKNFARAKAIFFKWKYAFNAYALYSGY